MQCAILNHFTAHKYTPTQARSGTISGNHFLSIPGQIQTIFVCGLNDPDIKHGCIHIVSVLVWISVFYSFVMPVRKFILRTYISEVQCSHQTNREEGNNCTRKYKNAVIKQ
jgi:hypothetical protein